MGTPRAKRRRQSAVVNWRLWKTENYKQFFFILVSCTLGLSCSGHMSTMPVTRDSTIQNSESMPMVTSMKKNTTAQIDPPGNFNTTWVN